MKVLIVDDEKHVRRTIRLLVDWKAMQVDEVLEAEDGAEAMELIARSEPQLVITDMMMPLRNGMELLEWIDAHAPRCKKLVISGYNDFEFVRHTVKHGGTDYLLKPIVAKQLTEAVGKALTSWREEHDKRLQERHRHEEVAALRGIYRDKLLSGLMREPTEADVRQLCEETPELRKAGVCRVALLRFELLERHIREQFAANRSGLAAVLLELCHGELAATRSGLAFLNLNSKYEIGLLLWGDPPAAEAALERIQQRTAARLRTRFDIGVGDALPSPASLNESFRQAQQALRQRNLLDPATRIHKYSREEELRVSTLRFGEFNETIGLALKSGRSEQLEAALGRWFDVLASLRAITVRMLELWLDEYNALLARWVEDYLTGADAGPQLAPETLRFGDLPIGDDGQFSLPLFRSRVARHLQELMEALLRQKAQSGHAMLEIAKYIEANYTSNITLQDISAQFHLNREYISRKFKQELKENVIDYLNRIRIEKAKLLLMNPHMKISEAARSVGYQDEKYFSRVFKKVEGQSPTEFRARFLL